MGPHNILLCGELHYGLHYFWCTITLTVNMHITVRTRVYNFIFPCLFLNTLYNYYATVCTLNSVCNLGYCSACHLLKKLLYLHCTMKLCDILYLSSTFSVVIMGNNSLRGRTIKFTNSPPCLPWQHWTKALVWFDDVNISAFHSCVLVDLWQSLSE